MTDTVYKNKEGTIRVTGSHIKSVLLMVLVLAGGGTLDHIRVGESRNNVDMLDTHLDVVRDRLDALENSVKLISTNRLTLPE